MPRLSRSVQVPEETALVRFFRALFFAGSVFAGATTLQV